MLRESLPQTWHNVAINVPLLNFLNYMSPFNAKHLIAPAPMYLTITFVTWTLSLSRPCASSTVTHVGTSLSGPAAMGLPGRQMSEFLVGIACVALHCEIEAANTLKTVLYCKSSSQANVLFCIQCGHRVHDVHVHAEHGVCVRRTRHSQDGSELWLILSTRKL